MKLHAMNYRYSHISIMIKKVF